MTKKEAEPFKKLLLTMQERLNGSIRQKQKDTLKKSPRDASGDLSGYTFHMADMATDNFDTEFALSLVSNEQDVLYEIEEALKRIEEGSYGDCLDCGKKINAQRLKAVPYTSFCVTCQEKKESGRES